MTHPDEERVAFYSCLLEAIHSAPSKGRQKQACLAWSAGLTWTRQGKLQWSAAAQSLRRGKPGNHQHGFQIQGCSQGHLDAPKIKALALARLHHHQAPGP